MDKIPIMRTARLTLRPLQPEDAVILHRIYQTEGVLRYFPNPNPPALEKVLRFVIEQEHHWEKYGYGNWGILPNDQSEIIGWAGLQFLLELDETEVGYLMDKPYWGKGYATEAARLSLQFGFNHFALPRMVGLVHPENIASRRVLEKCGMTYEKTIPIWGINLMKYYIQRQPAK